MNSRVLKSEVCDVKSESSEKQEIKLPCPLLLRLQYMYYGIYTVLFPCSETSIFFLLRFALGPAVLESEFRADHESGLRIEQSPRGHYESSV